jgi:hypothetical protein
MATPGDGDNASQDGGLPQGNGDPVAEVPPGVAGAGVGGGDRAVSFLRLASIAAKRPGIVPRSDPFW